MTSGLDKVSGFNEEPYKDSGMDMDSGFDLDARLRFLFFLDILEGSEVVNCFTATGGNPAAGAYLSATGGGCSEAGAFLAQSQGSDFSLSHC